MEGQTAKYFFLHFLWALAALAGLLAFHFDGIRPLSSLSLTVQTEHFQLFYSPGADRMAVLTADSAERAWAELTAAGYVLPTEKRIEIRLYPNTKTLAQSLGWEKNEKAMGAYFQKKIAVLSPEMWMNNVTDEKEFDVKGPMLHELVHLLVDEMTEGNYNRWWTEGMAQFIEKSFHDTQMSQPSEVEAFYSLHELEQNFDSIPVSQSYWQSLLAIEYIAQTYTEDALPLIMQQAAACGNFSEGLCGALHCGWDDLEKGYAACLKQNSQKIRRFHEREQI